MQDFAGISCTPEILRVRTGEGNGDFMQLGEIEKKIYFVLNVSMLCIQYAIIHISFGSTIN